MVDGVAASVYIDFLGGEAAAHRSAAKYRLAARFVPRLVRWLHDRGLNQPLLLFMARVLPEVREYVSLVGRLSGDEAPAEEESMSITVRSGHESTPGTGRLL